MRIRRHFPRPYPVGRYAKTIPPGATVAVEGMGLVATDVVMALTVGRGGSFAENGDRLRYVASGQTSRRSGSSPEAASPTAAKAVATVDESDAFEAVVCTKEAIGRDPGRTPDRAAPAPDRLSLRGPAPHPGRDADQVLLPVGLSRRAVAQPRTRSEPSSDGPGSDGSYETVVATSPAATASSTRGLHFFGPQQRLRLLQGLRVADLLDGRGRPRRVAPRAARRR